jgi:hypothetical protein
MPTSIGGWCCTISVLRSGSASSRSREPGRPCSSRRRRRRGDLPPAYRARAGAAPGVSIGSTAGSRR